MTKTTYRVGVDVGGTFTDFAMVPVDAPSGTAPVRHHKVPSTPAQPGEAIAQGLADLLSMEDIDPSSIVYLGHGTTVATNQLIERKGARTGLITTAGFRDVLEIARQTRPHLYDYSVRRAPPLVPRRWRLEVYERMSADGKVVRALDEQGVIDAGRTLSAANVEAIAICFLHSYRNAAHEERARDIIRTVVPTSVQVCTSSEVMPEFREFERVSTTCANAALSPRMDAYLGHFLGRLADLNIDVSPYTFHSNGGLMSPETVRQFPVRTCLSGPAAGVVGAAAIARAADHLNVVTFDVGGTSTDVSLIANGEPGFSQERSVAGYLVKSPTIDVHVIGAGGGSIAWLDEGGALKVGPHSAGAVPGPAAYGAGGTAATLTDANVVLCRLNPHALLGGGLSLDAQASRAVLDEVGEALGRTAFEAALGIVQVAVASIARAIRAVSTERGHELSQFSLMAFGGAGPVLAGEVAREVRCAKVVVPPAPGAMCARGILVSDVSMDYVRTSACLADDTGWLNCQALSAQMREQANEWFAHEGVERADQVFRYSVDARYVGQGFEVAVPFELGATVAEIIAHFHIAHERQYGYALVERRVELVNVRLQALGRLGAPVQTGAATISPADPVARDVYFADGWQRVPVFMREALAFGSTWQGPLVVEELSSTTLVLPGDDMEVDQFGNLVIMINE
ncbi:MAG: N-methylhydantoinase A [Gammaproteobacteria bacterium]|jgi:N-methylhydantoinase A